MERVPSEPLSFEPGTWDMANKPSTRPNKIRREESNMVPRFSRCFSMDDMDEIFLDLTATSLQWWLGLGLTIPIFLGPMYLNTFKHIQKYQRYSGFNLNTRDFWGFAHPHLLGLVESCGTPFRGP
jgi:hypothetical protein